MFLRVWPAKVANSSRCGGGGGGGGGGERWPFRSIFLNDAPNNN